MPTQEVLSAIRPYIRLSLRQQHPNEYHFLVQGVDNLRAVVALLHDAKWRLITMFANDERLLEDCRFKIYYIFSAPDEDVLLTLEYLLPRRGETWEHADKFPGDLFYTSVRDLYPAVQPFEEAIADTFGLLPIADAPAETTRILVDAHILHESFWQRLFPLRRTRPLARLQKERANAPRMTFLPPVEHLPEGMRILPVGPIHAGVIEAGRFHFVNAGEIIEELPIRLGYKHRGIAKLFETHYTLENGWKLAELASGDVSFSHSMAYCQAVEALAQIEPPPAAQYWRALLLEIERIANHIHDVGGILHDVSLDVMASQIALYWEAILQMNQRWFDRRLLREINRPGGVELPKRARRNRADLLTDISETLAKTVSSFLAVGRRALFHSSFQDRTVNTGILTRYDAERMGATGFFARASGMVKQDVRILHPRGVYDDAKIQEILASTFTPASGRWISLEEKDMRGDVYARFALRLAEVETSFQLIDELIHRLGAAPTELIASDATRRIENAWAYAAGLGYAESWRGGVFYWVMKGAQHSIARCKITGPSILNWFVFPLAVARNHDIPEQTNILPDFPLINKSFNLSYSERDL